MIESTMPAVVRHSTPRAALAALGLKVQQLDLFRPIREQVHIQQKTVRYTPTDKRYDAWIVILAGAHGLVEVNTRLRSDPALHAAFGRTACAEQSKRAHHRDTERTENIKFSVRSVSLWCNLFARCLSARLPD